MTADEPLETSVFAALDADHRGGALGVAVSGGGDSVALMLLAREWCATRGVPLFVATVDHGLRAESESEARSVFAAASDLGIPASILTWSGWNGRGNLQNAARQARKSLLSGWAVENGVGAVALGHTMDDQAETVLMRLGRGSGVDGLSAMAARSGEDEIAWLRPLLGVRREALRSWLRERGARWVDDPSNDDLRFDRVKARRALSSLSGLGITVEGLAATASRLGAARDALDAAATDLAAAAARWGECGEVRLDLPRLRAAPPEISRRLFRATLIRVAGAEYGPRAEAEADALGAMLGLRLGGGRSLHGCLIRPDGPTGAIIAREAAAVDAEAKTQIGGALWDGRFQIDFSEDSGEGRIAPVGADGDRRIRELTAEGALSPSSGWLNAPKAARIATPALWRDGEMTAAPLAGFGAGLTARFAARDPLSATG